MPINKCKQPVERSNYLRYLLRALLAFLGVVLAVWWLLWLYLLGPVGYAPPEAADYAGEPYQVFVYGTLKQPLVRRFIIGRSVEVTEDKLAGYQPQGLDLVIEPDAVTEGLRFKVSAAEMKRLDRYERLGVRYQREQVMLLSGQQAWVYRLLRDNDKSH